jgi:hypothetical protein
MTKEQAITVAGVTFTADQVKSVTLNVGGREVKIDEPSKKKSMGFGQEDSEKD